MIHQGGLMRMPLPELDRRAWLQLGGLSLLGAAANRSFASDAPGGKQRACIFILLQGGPSHHDLWDPKPLASPEIRGPFGVINTATGMQFGELLVQSANISDKLCVVRSMTHRFNNHIGGTYIALTGSTNQPDQDREAHEDDFPGPGGILQHLADRTRSVPRAVSLPNWLSIPGPSNRMPGQYGGFLGSTRNPFVIEGDPNQKGYRPLSLTPPQDVTLARLQDRLSLSQQLDAQARNLERDLRQQYDALSASAYGLIADGRVRRALDLNEEKPEIRDRYGRTKIGQSLLLARRLVEAGVQFVAYNAFNQEWDTHGDLQNRYKQIVPPMDQAFAGLVQDLGERGMLDDTLVINTGEFGRTPRVNKDGGRDHWPNAYSTVLAGGGVRGGIAYGQTDRHGGEVLEKGVSPADLLATMWSRLGIDHTAQIYDRLKRPHLISDGRVVGELIG
jgi:uncharacterized protein (DUF1501 family)